MFDIFNFAPEILTWIDDAVLILGVISAVIGRLFYSKNKQGKELTKLIDESPLNNKEFLKIADKAGLKDAALILSKLIK